MKAAQKLRSAVQFHGVLSVSRYDSRGKMIFFAVLFDWLVVDSADKRKTDFANKVLQKIPPEKAQIMRTAFNGFKHNVEESPLLE
jgi:hypothetical protein